MLSRAKDTVRNLGLEPYLKIPYQLLVQNPYWVLRRQFYPKTKQTIAGIDTEFIAEGPIDVSYHEFKSEEPIIEDIISEIEKDDIFYDIGANIGLYSCVISKVLNEGNVVAFEPSPPAYRKLRKNAELNEDRFRHYQVAISDTNSKVEFSVDVGDKQSRQSTLNTDRDGNGYEIETVSSRQLSSIVSEEDIPSPTIVKIDVEGAEYKVLRGMDDLLDNVRIVYGEIHHPVLDDFGTTGSEIIGFLESANFDIERLYQRGNNEFIKATR
jgi:FkbM family methyltransferase